MHHIIRRLCLLVSAASSQVKTIIRINELHCDADTAFTQYPPDSLGLHTNIRSLESYLLGIQQVLASCPDRQVFPDWRQRHAYDSLIHAAEILRVLSSVLSSCREAANLEQRMLQSGPQVGRIGIPPGPPLDALKRASKMLTRYRDGFRDGPSDVQGWRAGLSAYTNSAT